MAPVCCSFLAFPAELRIYIYRLLLISARPSTIYTDSPPYILANDLHPAVLCTCRSIYAEAQDMLYDFNTFRIDLRHTDLASVFRPYAYLLFRMTITCKC